MTVTIGLITTGQCEHRALAGSLARMFAECDVEFRSLLGGPADSLTSGRVTHPAPRAKVPTVADRLVQRMQAELERRDGPDFVIAVDDLELDNIEAPGNVSGVVRDAIVRAMGDVPTHTQQARFRDHCSFHLLCPMVEAYFYGEPAALVRAGAKQIAMLTPTHLEDFMSGDVTYLSGGGNLNHPKHYLQFLASPDRYRETIGVCARAVRRYRRCARSCIAVSRGRASSDRTPGERRAA